MSKTNSLWTEKHRPTSLDEYVWRDANLKTKVEQWVHDKRTPHVLFSGDPGVGKTSLAYLILSEIGIPTQDILYIPCSRLRKIDEVMDQVRSFIQTWAWNDTEMKYVILDEADSLSQNVQKALRADMEIYESSCRFILTCNYPQRIIQPLHSRVEHYNFTSLDYESFLTRLLEIVVIEWDGQDLTEEDGNIVEAIARECYPDMRKSINTLQQCSYTDLYAKTGSDISVCRRSLVLPKKEDHVGGKPFMITAADLIKGGKLKAARKLIVESASADEYPELFRWMYQNLDLWGPTEDQQDEALLAIRKGLVHHSMVADVEINLSATLVDLAIISRKHLS